ncbi:glutathione transferase GstA [Zhongshania sp.]|jgi:glutathione S-transferase|uniref:glutathione transferase GstA n=1 Tax=Zhongshania sp. TaxID=1971902 RepID=UPI002A7F587E|nr:glutathione transferase GstA [Zhongshania sp.]
MKLYYAPGTCSLSPHIILKELGLIAELERVDLKTHTTAQGDDFCAINSRGQVPVLALDDGSLLREGNIIVQYLADKANADNLLPAAGSITRYQVMEWQNYVSSEIHKSYAPLFNPDLNAEGKQTLVRALYRKYQWLDTHLAKSNYLSGDEYCVADAYLFVVSRWSAAVDLDLSGLAALQAFLAKVSARPAVQAAMDAEGLL